MAGNTTEGRRTSASPLTCRSALPPLCGFWLALGGPLAVSDQPVTESPLARSGCWSVVVSWSSSRSSFFNTDVAQDLAEPLVYVLHELSFLVLVGRVDGPEWARVAA
jgi:hypothetical protein